MAKLTTPRHRSARRMQMEKIGAASSSFSGRTMATWYRRQERMHTHPGDRPEYRRDSVGFWRKQPGCDRNEQEAEGLRHHGAACQGQEVAREASRSLSRRRGRPLGGGGPVVADTSVMAGKCSTFCRDPGSGQDAPASGMAESRPPGPVEGPSQPCQRVLTIFSAQWPSP